VNSVLWEKCRRSDWSLDLHLAARHTGCLITAEADGYLACVEAICPIRSRQVAALAIANALRIVAESYAAKEKI